jgi:branched-chain amino acid transport system substrate-binding protein
MLARTCAMVVAVWLLIAISAPQVRAETGVTATTVTIGQSVSLSGPTGSLGQEMQAGAVAYFDYINKHGGINGRTILFKTLDDGYEVERTVANVKTLIEHDHVFALFGLRGTAHTNAAAKVFTPAKVPLFATFSGAASLREPFNRYIFHFGQVIRTKPTRSSSN